MKFSIVTPSFRSSRWLKLCVASVADQGVEIEHIVQDACSDDGTWAWLSADARVRAFVEPDQGMYDAINRGLRRSTGDIVAYLNCDEQYLPGALAYVAEFFAAHPSVDVAFGDAVVTSSSGDYLCHREALLPMSWHTRVSRALAILSCATFFRRRLLEERALFFNTRYRAMGDAQWVLDLLEQGVSMGLLRVFTSVFSITGANLADSAVGRSEAELIARGAPLWQRALRPAIVAHHRVRKLLAGHYFSPPFDYAVYTLASPAHRVSFHVDRPVAIWRTRLT